MPDEARLLEVAAAVAEGSEVDWNTLAEGTSDGRERTVIRELHRLADVARAMRSPSLEAPLTVQGPRGDTVNNDDALKSWGHLRILEKLGGGTYGVVYRAWETRLECEVALKLARPAHLSRDLDASRALREARMLARVRHQNVVKVHGADTQDGRFGLWMELVSGRTLEQVLATHGPMGAHEAAHVGIELCRALAAVHSVGLLHRDIKASNVMRENGGRLLLMDFGAGRALPAPDLKTVDVAGTPLYLAPELFFGDKPSPASDIYSLGVLLYHLVTGDYPVGATTREAIQLAHRRNQRRPLGDARPDLPAPFVNVIERALSPVSSERYQTAGTFGNALAAAAGTANLDTPEGVPKPRSATWKTIAAAAAAIAAVALLAVTQIEWAPQTSSPGSGDIATPGAASLATSSQRGDIVLPASTYQVEAAFYVVREDRRVLLSNGSRVAPAEVLSLDLNVSRQVHVYVVNQDDQGESIVLFPLEGQSFTNPLPAGRHQLPGPRDGTEHLWQVSTAGGREHFFVYVSPTQLVDLERFLAPLPRAATGRTVQYRRLLPEAFEVLRSVGGLAPAPPRVGGLVAARPPATEGLADLPLLPQGSETTDGVWARRISFANPER